MDIFIPFILRGRGGGCLPSSSKLGYVELEAVAAHGSRRMLSTAMTIEGDEEVKHST